MAHGDPALDNNGRVLLRPEWYSRSEMNRALDEVTNAQTQVISLHEQLTSLREHKPLTVILYSPRPLRARRRLHWILRLIVR